MIKKVSKLKKDKSKIGTIIYNYIINNEREFLIITILFFIGLFVGVIYINNINDSQIVEVNNFLNNLFSNMNEYHNIDLLNLLKKSLTSNLFIVLLLWFGASTIIGIPVVYGTIIAKGFSLGCTISSIILSCGTGKGILISISLLLLQNIIFIPTMFSICISGIRLYKSIMKNKNRDNIKIEILRHTIFCTIMLLFMVVASFVEVYLSSNLCIILLKYIKI